MGCHDMISTGNDRLKIIDFEGCSIDGEVASSCYELFSYRRSRAVVSKQMDISAFNCAIYEIITARPPCHGPERYDDRARLVEQRHQHNQLPNFTHLLLGDVMRTCWNESFSSVSEAIHVLQATTRLLSFKAKSRPPSSGLSKAAPVSNETLRMEIYMGASYDNRVG